MANPINEKRSWEDLIQIFEEASKLFGRKGEVKKYTDIYKNSSKSLPKGC
jgi:hypothetical protein